MSLWSTSFSSASHNVSLPEETETTEDVVEKADGNQDLNDPAFVDESNVPFTETPFTIAARNAQIRRAKAIAKSKKKKSERKQIWANSLRGPKSNRAVTKNGNKNRKSTKPPVALTQGGGKLMGIAAKSSFSDMQPFTSGLPVSHSTATWSVRPDTPKTSVSSTSTAVLDGKQDISQTWIPEGDPLFDVNFPSPTYEGYSYSSSLQHPWHDQQEDTTVDPCWGIPSNQKSAEELQPWRNDGYLAELSDHVTNTDTAFICEGGSAETTTYPLYPVEQRDNRTISDYFIGEEQNDSFFQTAKEQDIPIFNEFIDYDFPEKPSSGEDYLNVFPGPGPSISSGSDFRGFAPKVAYEQVRDHATPRKRADLALIALRECSKARKQDLRSDSISFFSNTGKKPHTNDSWSTVCADRIGRTKIKEKSDLLKLPALSSTPHIPATKPQGRASRLCGSKNIPKPLFRTVGSTAEERERAQRFLNQKQK